VRFALNIGPASWLRENGIERTRELVQRADKTGFDTLWASEDPDGWDAFAALVSTAGATGRIRLGTGVTNPYLRHPNLIAASVATLDRVSGGRAFLGLGRGEPDWYRNAFGMELGSPLKRVEETIGLLRQWWGPEQVASGDGEIPVRSWRREFGPLGQPPIYLAATGPKMQRLAGRSADGVRFNTLASLPFLRASVEHARSGASEAGRGTHGLRFFANPSLTITDRSDDIEPILEKHKTTIALIHALPGMDRQLMGLDFDLERIMADVRQHMRTEEILARGGSFADIRREGDLDAAKRVIPLDLVDQVTVVGPLARVRERLAEYAAAGITDVFVSPVQLSDPDVLDDLAEL
jgi:5,10-methylenetetrahydromethanopterin reductase